LTSPIVDNALRRVLSPAVARCRLRSPKSAERQAAAAILAKGPPAELVPFLRQHLATESDEIVRSRLGLALAHADLASPDPALRLAAVRAVADARAVALEPRLQAMLKRSADGSFVETDATVRAAAAKAVAGLERRLQVTRVIRDSAYGLSQGSILLLVALGLAVTFGLMGVINMAHGEMLMLGAYTTYVVQGWFQRYLPGSWEYYLLAAIPAAFTVCLAAGVVLERAVIRHLYGRPLETLLATWGLSLVIIQSIRLGFSAQNVSVANPGWLSGGWELVDGVVLPYTRVASIAFAAVVVLLVWGILRFTAIGLQVRAIMQNRAMAANLGVPTGRVDMLTFGLGSAIAGLGGVALSQIGNVGPELGQLYIIDSFMVVVVGGVGKIIGTVLTAFGLGMVNKFLEPLMGSVLGKAAVLAAIILFIQRRPQGLFSPRGRAVEA
jgi:urea transport system permease protein